MKAKILGGLSGAGVMLGLIVPMANAQTATPSAAAITGATDLIDGMVGGLLGVIPTALEHAAPFVVTLVAIVFLIAVARHFLGH